MICFIYPLCLIRPGLLQFVIHNQQVYNLERKNALSRCILPNTVDLDVNTFLTFSQEVKTPSHSSELQIRGSLVTCLSDFPIAECIDYARVAACFDMRTSG